MTYDRFVKHLELSQAPPPAAAATQMDWLVTVGNVCDRPKISRTEKILVSDVPTGYSLKISDGSCAALPSRDRFWAPNGPIQRNIGLSITERVFGP